MARRSLKDIKVGDRVWVSSGHGNDRDRIQPVVRLTPTQIVLDGYYTGGASSEFNRYQRGKKSRYSDDLRYGQIGSGMWGSEITSIATEGERARWDAEQEAKRQKADAAKQESERIEAKRLELSGLFNPAHFYLRHDANNKAGAWMAQVWLPDEAAVRELAARINEMSLPTPTEE